MRGRLAEFDEVGGMDERAAYKARAASSGATKAISGLALNRERSTPKHQLCK